MGEKRERRGRERKGREECWEPSLLPVLYPRSVGSHLFFYQRSVGSHLFCPCFTRMRFRGVNMTESEAKSWTWRNPKLNASVVGSNEQVWASLEQSTNEHPNALTHTHTHARTRAHTHSSTQEVGSGVLQTGEVRTVKPLGVLCMIDDGEADWKVPNLNTIR